MGPMKMVVGGWHTGGADGCPACESTEDACNKIDDKGGMWYTLIGCTSDFNSLSLDKGNPQAMPKCPGSAIVLYLANIYASCIHINKIEILVPNNKIQKHKHKQFENYMTFKSTMIHVTWVTCPSQMDSPWYLLVPNLVETQENKKFEDAIK